MTGLTTQTVVAEFEKYAQGASGVFKLILDESEDVVTVRKEVAGVSEEVARSSLEELDGFVAHYDEPAELIQRAVDDDDEMWCGLDVNGDSVYVLLRNGLDSVLILDREH